jgi:hypothetical protein
MGLAPRDGTIVEIENNHGSRPWFEIYCWRNGEGWVSARDWSRNLFTDEHNFRWRPYAGKTDDYVDPTFGAQNTLRYWGIDRKRTIDDAEEASETNSWWDRLLALFRPEHPERPLDRYMEPADSWPDHRAVAELKTAQNASPQGQLGRTCEQTLPQGR